VREELVFRCRPCDFVEVRDRDDERAWPQRCPECGGELEFTLTGATG
jgi:predicted Zn-ribbon and HTH transcriptional regulator